MKLEIHEFADGSVALSCGDAGMESDLVFASGAMNGDPILDAQWAILEEIVGMQARVAELEAALVRVRDEIAGCLERDAKAFMAMTMEQVEAWDIARHNQSHGYCLDQIREVLK